MHDAGPLVAQLALASFVLALGRLRLPPGALDRDPRGARDTEPTLSVLTGWGKHRAEGPGAMGARESESEGVGGGGGEAAAAAGGAGGKKGAEAPEGPPPSPPPLTTRDAILALLPHLGAGRGGPGGDGGMASFSSQTVTSRKGGPGGEACPGDLAAKKTSSNPGVVVLRLSQLAAVALAGKDGEGTTGEGLKAWLDGDS